MCCLARPHRAKSRWRRVAARESAPNVSSAIWKTSFAIHLLAVSRGNDAGLDLITPCRSGRRRRSLSATDTSRSYITTDDALMRTRAPEPAICASRTTSAYVPFGRSLGAARVVVLCARSVSRGVQFAVLLPIRGGLQSGYGRAPTAQQRSSRSAGPGLCGVDEAVADAWFGD